MRRRDFVTIGAGLTGGYIGLKSLRQGSSPSPSSSDGNDGGALDSPTSTSSGLSEVLPGGYEEKIVVSEGLRAEQTHHFTQYGADFARVRIFPDQLNGDLKSDFKVVVGLFDAMELESVGYGTGNRFTGSNSNLLAYVDLTQVGEHDGPLRYVSVAIPGSETLKTVGEEEVVKLAESNQFQLKDGQIQRAGPASLDDVQTSTYTRENLEGMYYMTFQGGSGSASWRNSMYLYKSVYEWAIEQSRTRRIPEYVSHALEEGYARDIASILDESARANGYTTKREWTEFVIDFVQNLPYVSDNVSTGYDDYSKFVAETLVEGEGDCEDTTILTASILSADPFNYDTVLIYLPGHIAVGIYGKSLPGTYYEDNGRRYYYLETTGEGWNVGELPDEYRNEKARIVRV